MKFLPTKARTYVDYFQIFFTIHDLNTNFIFLSILSEASQTFLDIVI
jgi:hypothetical protein